MLEAKWHPYVDEGEEQDEEDGVDRKGDGGERMLPENGGRAERERNAVMFIVLSIYRKEHSPQTPVFLLHFFASETDLLLLFLLPKLQHETLSTTSSRVESPETSKHQN